MSVIHWCFSKLYQNYAESLSWLFVKCYLILVKICYIFGLLAKFILKNLSMCWDLYTSLGQYYSNFNQCLAAKASCVDCNAVNFELRISSDWYKSLTTES